MSEKLLILGGTGFIGRHLAKESIRRGFDTFVLSLNIPIEEKKVTDVHYISADLTKLEQLKDKLHLNKFEYIVNLSGYIDHSSFSDGGKNIIDTHFLGMQNLIYIINKKKLKRFIQIGSSDEYGNNPAPQNEQMPPKPFSPYSLAKVASTQFLQMLFNTESFPATILRIFLVYGPGQNNSRFLPQVIRGCIENSKFPVSTGEQLRDFCFIDDLIEGIFLCLQSNKVNGHIINLGSGDPISIRKVINLIQHKVGKGNPEFGKIPYRPEENMELYANISKAQDLMDWNPKISLEEGIRKTINHYRKNI